MNNPSVWSSLLSNPSVFWVVAVIVFAILEAASMGLTAIWFACGALGAAVAALFGVSVIVQIVVFIAVSLICIFYTKPFVQKRLKVNKVATNLDRNVGKQGIVTEEIDNTLGKGQVKVGGLVWTARSENDEKIAANVMVEVVEIKGVKLIVKTVI